MSMFVMLKLRLSITMNKKSAGPQFNLSINPFINNTSIILQNINRITQSRFDGLIAQRT